MKPLCIYHGKCADGFTAAWAVWKRFGDKFDYHAGIYQDPPPDVRGRDVVLVDFSYKRPVLQAMREVARSILVLDHHKSAAEDLAQLPGNKNFGIDISSWGDTDDWWDRHLVNVQQDEWEGARDTVYVLFDQGRSGAGITWDFFYRAKRPALVDYVEDRDLWRFKLPWSREINAAIFSYDYSFENWDRLFFLVQARESIVAEGAAIERKHHRDVAELVAATRRELCIGGHWVPVSNLPHTLASDAGHVMLAPYASPNLQGEIVTPPFAASYWDTPDGRVFSLRSADDFDVSAIAKLFGGGGHKNAAGFRIPLGIEAPDLARPVP